MSNQFTHGYALLIGVDENQIDKWALPDVAKDIAALERVLTHPDRCAYPAGNVKTVTGPAATRQGVLDGLDWLDERIRAADGDATAIIYYSGHGWRDTASDPPTFYLIPYDIRQGQVRSRALRAVDFAEAVGALEPRRLLVALDCCHAAGMGIKDLAPLPDGYVGAAIPPRLLLAGEATSPTAGAKGLETLAQGAGRAVLSSSQGEQSSYLRRDRTMSIFTYHLIEALTGHAQPQAGATEVLVSDVMSHVHRRVPRSARADWDRDQIPDYQVSGNFPLALLLGGKGFSKGQPAPDPLESGGGAYIERGVQTDGGDFIDRDKVVYGDEVRGDKVLGDKVAGDKITTGDISGTGIAIGRRSRAAVSQGPGGEEMARRFAAVYRQIEARPEDPDLDKAELAETVHKIEAEAARGQGANPRKIERWLKTLALMAPDIRQVTVACLARDEGGPAG